MVASLPLENLIPAVNFVPMVDPMPWVDRIPYVPNVTIPRYVFNYCFRCRSIELFPLVVQEQTGL